ncbi:hypothetical protein ACHAXA_007032 [Cyclostephanos tholiformis]|uniref:SET domain-containing protein n=1 Tax=Cyclostephanos tholiformis TaxID=382380 RepID=A0ABD3RC82_9STRA
MQRLTLIAGLRRAKSAIGSRNCIRPTTPITSPVRPYPISTVTSHYLQCASFSNDNAAFKPPDKKRRGFIAKTLRILRTIVGADDDTPRGIQERKEMYSILLSVAHYRLRTEHQRKLAQQQPTSFMWQEESRELLKHLIDVAVSHLDEKTDITQMSLRRLRNEVQTFLGPQIVHLLTVAHDMESEMDEENDGYVFSEREEKKYRECLFTEYQDLCQLINDWKRNNTEAKQKKTPDPLPFYERKKGSIETLLTYFDWWPEHASADGVNTNTTNGEDYIDEFGFSPNKSESDIVRAMRYYHARNLVRSFLTRRAADNFAIGNDDADGFIFKQPRCYHSLLPLKSTIPSAGRGVFVDGFAPAGTLMAFIPGKVWTKEHLQSASPQTQMQLSQNDPRHQLSMRYDDVLIDSRQSPYTVVKNLWALGHIVNHPPAPTASEISCTLNTHENGRDECVNSINHRPFQGPNCVTVMINFTDPMIARDGEKLRDYIPNEYELPPKPYVKNIFEKDEVIMHGMGLIASRDVKDEELFYDYRLSPKQDKTVLGNQYPEWYHIWDEEAIINRWENDDE